MLIKFSSMSSVQLKWMRLGSTAFLPRLSSPSSSLPRPGKYYATLVSWQLSSGEWEWRGRELEEDESESEAGIKICTARALRYGYEINITCMVVALLRFLWDEKIKSFNSCIVLHVTFSSCLSLIVHSPWFHVWRRTTGELIVPLNLTSLLICCKVRERVRNNCGDRYANVGPSPRPSSESGVQSMDLLNPQQLLPNDRSVCGRISGGFTIIHGTIFCRENFLW